MRDRGVLFRKSAYFCFNLDSFPVMLRLTICLGLICLLQPSLYATNGLHCAAPGNKSRGMVGAGVAFPQEALSAAINPAGMTAVPNELDVGVRVFVPIRSYTATTGTGPMPIAPGKVKSGSEVFVIPEIGYRYGFAEGRGAAGFTFCANGGLNTNYKTSVFGAGDAGGNLLQGFFSPSISWKVTPKFSIGGSIVGAFQRVDIRGVQSFAPLSSDPSNLSNRGKDYSYGVGVKLGFLYQVVPQLTIGASVQPPIPMTKFNRYKGLFEGGGRFDVPATSTVGFAWRVTDPFTLVFDVQHIAYSTNKALHNGSSCRLGGGPCLGNKGGTGFGWKNLLVYKIGANWGVDNDWALRCGYSHSNQTVPSAQVLFNSIAPAVIQDHVSAGVSKKVNESNELNFSFLYAFKNSVSGQNSFSPDQTIKLTMEQFTVGLNWVWMF